MSVVSMGPRATTHACAQLHHPYGPDWNLVQSRGGVLREPGFQAALVAFMGTIAPQRPQSCISCPRGLSPAPCAGHCSPGTLTTHSSTTTLIPAQCRGRAQQAVGVQSKLPHTPPDSSVWSQFSRANPAMLSTFDGSSELCG